MSQEKLTLAALNRIDSGRIKAAWEQALANARADCEDRPALDKARKIALVAYVKPLTDDKGELESCNVYFDIVETTPKRTTKTYNMGAARGALVFNEMSPDDNKQHTIDEVMKPRKVKDASAS